MAPGAEVADRDRRRPSAVRHGCWLLLVIAGISTVVLVAVGWFGLVGPIELAVIVGTVTASVVVADRFSSRS